MTNKVQHIATLVFPNDYMRNLNSVAGLTSQNVIFLKRKFLSDAGYELVEYPLADCAMVEYKEELPVIKIALGALLLGLIVFILVLLAIYWNDLEPRTRVPAGAIIVGGFYGARVAFGGRRHRIDVTLKDGTTLVWKSKSGEFKLMADIAARFVEFSQNALLTSGLAPKAGAGESR